MSQTIHLHQATRAALKDHAAGRANLGQLQPHIEAYWHEVMHWYDLVGTLWGARFLDLIYLCLDIRESRPNSAEDEFHKLVELYDAERRIISPKYYHLVMDETRRHSSRRPWRLQLSSGLEFDAYGYQDTQRPIFFVRFSDNHTDALVARQPLTVGALLETKALASELHTGIEFLIAESKSESELEFQIKHYSREKSGFLYDRDLTMYTAPAHLLSRFVGTKETILTYEYAAALANVALNMSDTHFNSLKHPDSFAEFGEQRLEAFQKSQDRGYAFAALAVQADRYDPKVSLSQWLDTALERSGLTSYAQFSKRVRNALTNRPRLTLQVDSLLEARQEIENAGLAFFDSMTANGIHWIAGSHIFQQGLPIPPAFDVDGNLFSLGKHLEARAFHPEIQFEREWELIKYRDNFLGGARGVRIAGT